MSKKDYLRPELEVKEFMCENSLAAGSVKVGDTDYPTTPFVENFMDGETITTDGGFQDI